MNSQPELAGSLVSCRNGRLREQLVEENTEILNIVYSSLRKKSM